VSLSTIAGAGDFLSRCERREVEDRKLRLYTLYLRPARREGRGRDASRDGFRRLHRRQSPDHARRALTSTTSSRAARR